MSVAVLVPWRSDGAHREKLWNFLSTVYWPSLGGKVEVFESDSDPDLPFSRAQAVNRAAAKAGDWDTAIIADADTFVSAAAIRTAIQMAVYKRKVVIPFTVWRSITREVTRELIAGTDLPTHEAEFPFTVERPQSLAVSGSVVVPREAWDKVGGMDEAFTRYGWEDRAFMRAISLTGGYRRQNGVAWHLWHRRDAEVAARGKNWATDEQSVRFHQIYERAGSFEELQRMLAS